MFRKKHIIRLHMKTTKKQKIIIQVGVKALIFNKARNVLIIKRNTEKYPEVNNLWDIPGGRIDTEVSLEENLKREIFEEVNLSNVKTLALVSAQDIIKPDKHVVRLTYVSCATDFANLKLSDEHIEYRWISIEDLKILDGLDRYVKEIIKDNNKVSFIKNTVNKG